ncbi:hypothetical protein CNMCM5623_007185 [Aspergillus felis]|uniref:Uncharacterized protein n=1 Tax=Aspergillus felis TaxID=1287682 RepID=A0A8H6UNV1_9EURO|nr:hypothetical protein CNMCM5623_007185 [Aspergillus felis]
MQLSKAIIFCFLALQTTYALPVANPDPQSLQEICCSVLDEMFAAASAAASAAAATAKEAAEIQLQIAMKESLGNLVGNAAINCEAACQGSLWAL